MEAASPELVRVTVALMTGMVTPPQVFGGGHDLQLWSLRGN